MKKILSIILVITLLLTTAGTALAADELAYAEGEVVSVYEAVHEDVAALGEERMYEITFDFGGVRALFSDHGSIIFVDYGPIVFERNYGEPLFNNMSEIPSISRLEHSWGQGSFLKGWCLVGDGTAMIFMSPIPAPGVTEHFTWHEIVSGLMSGSISTIVEGPMTFYPVWMEFWHEVSWDANGGYFTWAGSESPLWSLSVAHFSPIMFPDSHLLERTGYTFVGWCKVGDGSSMLNDLANDWEFSLEMTYAVRSHAFYAIWERDGTPIDHTITFDLNGGHFGPGWPFVWEFTRQDGEFFSPGNYLPLSQPMLQDYIFTGWCRVGDGSSILSDNEFNNGWIVEESKTFYAMWEHVPIHDLVFDPDGGYLSFSPTHWQSYPLVLPAPQGRTLWLNLIFSMMRPGYSFVGWCLEGDGSDLVQQVLWGTNVIWWTVTGPQTFYAIWQPDGNTPCADTNLARDTRGAVMSASSVSTTQPVRTAERANNGITSGAVTNSWSADGPGQEWLMVDFGEQLNFNHIRIFQAGNRIANYRFEYSNDGVTWTQFHYGIRIMEQTPAFYEFRNPSTIQAQYVRLFSENSFGALPIAVFELEVYYMP